MPILVASSRLSSDFKFHWRGPRHPGLQSWWSDVTSVIMSINFFKFSRLLEFWLAILGKVTGMQWGKTVHSQKSMRACLEVLPLDLLPRHTWLVYDLILIVQTLSYYFLFMNVNMTGNCMYDPWPCMYLHVSTCNCTWHVFYPYMVNIFMF